MDYYSSNSSPPTQQEPNSFNVNNFPLDFGRFIIDDCNVGDHKDVSGGADPVKGATDGDFSEQIQGTTTLPSFPLGYSSVRSQETTTGPPSIPPSPLVNLPTSQEFLDANKAGWPTTSLKSSQNIWALPNVNINGGTGNTSFQDPLFGMISQPASPYPSYLKTISSIYGNQDLVYLSRMQCSSGNDVGLFSQGFLANNANQGMEIPSVYAERKEDCSLPPGFNVLEMSLCPIRSADLRKILEQGRYLRGTLEPVIPSIFELMSDRHGCRIFEVLLEKIESCDLYAIVKKVASERETFVNLAYYETGSRSIQRLIKKLKNTGFEAEVALVLSRFAYEMMTHKIASHVIRQCFCSWGEAQNAVLHDSLFKDFQNLAMDPIGCLTINFWIDNTPGARRSQLLNLVAKNARSLSRDPSGNFVVQHVLKLELESVTKTICCNLSGMFVELAQMKGGSHVVERCLELSHFGRVLVTAEIFRNAKTLLMLAKDQYGNYVVQKALKLAKMYDLNLYQKLIQRLKQTCWKLVEKVEGKSCLLLQY